MTGTGRCGGAATVVNAFATGRGAAFGLAFEVSAHVDAAKTWSVRSNGQRLKASEAKLAVATAKLVQEACGAHEALAIDVRSNIPPKKGLKSSSAVSVAVAQATLAHYGK